MHCNHTFSGLCYSEVVTRFPKGGSAYSYVYATVGELFAFLVGWGMILEYTMGTALAAKACSQYLDVVLDGRLSGYLQHQLGHLSMKGLDTFLDVPSVGVTLVACVLMMASVKVSLTLCRVLGGDTLKNVIKLCYTSDFPHQKCVKIRKNTGCLVDLLLKI